MCQVQKFNRLPWLPLANLFIYYMALCTLQSKIDKKTNFFNQDRPICNSFSVTQSELLVLMVVVHGRDRLSVLHACSEILKSGQSLKLLIEQAKIMIKDMPEEVNGHYGERGFLT